MSCDLFFSNILSKSIYGSGYVSHWQLIIILLLSLSLIAVGLKFYKYFIGFDALVFGVVVGHFVSKYIQFDSFVLYGLFGIILCVTSIFAKSVFVGLASGVSGALLASFIIISFTSWIELQTIFIISMSVALVFVGVSFVKYQIMMVISSAIQGVVLLFFAIIGMIHGLGKEPSSAYYEMSHDLISVPIVIFFVFVTASIILQLITDQGETE